MDLKVLFELRNIKISEIEQYSMQETQKENIKTKLNNELIHINNMISFEEDKVYK